MTKQQLKEYCEAEFENMEAVLSEMGLVVNSQKSKYSIAELAAIATFLHNFYNGIENIFKRILTYSNVEFRDSATWHKDILKTSSEKGLISDDLYVTLSNYLSFRHFFVHSYSITLRWEELKTLVDDVNGTFVKFKTSTYTYIEQLD